MPAESAAIVYLASERVSVKPVHHVSAIRASSGDSSVHVDEGPILQMLHHLDKVFVWISSPGAVYPCAQTVSFAQLPILQALRKPTFSVLDAPAGASGRVRRHYDVSLLGEYSGIPLRRTTCQYSSSLAWVTRSERHTLVSQPSAHAPSGPP